MTDFEYYCDDFGGFIIDSEEEFERLGEMAEKFVRDISCTEPDFDSDDVKSCVCAMADVYAENGLYAGTADGFEEERSDGVTDELMHTAGLYLPLMLMSAGL